jgi:hypothetical protein
MSPTIRAHLPLRRAGKGQAGRNRRPLAVVDPVLHFVFEGEEALLAWLRSPHEAPIQARVEGMLRFFFIDALPREEQMKAAHLAQKRLREYREHMYDKDLRSALMDFEEGGIRAPVLVGLFAESMLERGEEFLAQLEAMMRAELEAELKKKRDA